MPVLLHQQPVLTLALDSFQDTTIDESDIRRMWIIFTKCKDDIKNGFRLENISWRIWYKKYLNNSSDLFSNDKEYNKKQAMDDSNSEVHSVESSTNFSLIEPIEVLKKCACGEQLISSSLNSLSTPHSEYTCFDKQICIHHQKSNSISKESSQKTLVTENQNTTDNHVEETVVEVPKDETISIPASETTVTEEDAFNSDEKEEIEENKENNEIKKEEEEKEKEEVISTINTNNSNTTNSTITKDSDTTTATIPPNCPTIEQFYQKQILLLQQVYLQKQQQLQYQKQQMTISQEQMYQHQMYLQQWYNQQQQQLMANCTTYYNKYLQQHFGQVLTQPSTTESTQPSNQTSSEQPLETKYIEDEEDYDDEDDDDYYYSDEDIIDEDDVDVDEDEDYADDEPVEDDLFKKVATPKLKKVVAKPSLLSAMIKESNYNEYKKTVEYIQKCDDDAQRLSNNIYSIKDYNCNCINSLNKNERRKRAPSFEDVRNAQQNLRKLIEMHPIYQNTNIQENTGNDDIEEYYEKGVNQFNNITTNNQNSYSTINTMASQDSHCTAYTNHSSHYGVYGSNKTTHSNHSSKSQGPHLNRASNNNSVNRYMNKKR